MSFILGINAYHGDAAAALIKDGRIIAAAEEERFTRIKHNAGFPIQAIRYCLKEGGIELRDVSHMGLSKNPWSHWMERLYSNLKRSVKRRSPDTVSDRLLRMKKILNMNQLMENEFGRGSMKGSIHFVEHHLAHMASAYYASGFDGEAAVLSIDAFGDYVSTKWGVHCDQQMEALGEVVYPHSIGIVYTALTQYLGFPHYGDEYKVMGLSAYGKPIYEKEFDRIIQLENDGKFSIHLDYFRHHNEGTEMIWQEGPPTLEPIYNLRLCELFGPARRPDEPIEKRHEDIAASLQRSSEKAIYHVMNHLHQKTRQDRLCLAGGVAFNSVANGKILKETPFRQVFIQPAAGDAGTALGVAYWVSKRINKQISCQKMDHAYYGSQYTNAEMNAALERANIPYRTMDDSQLIDWVSERIAMGKIVGWFQGRMEFGPRALGNRSILADPRKREMKDELNRRVKRREGFRPYAPAVLEEKAKDYFETNGRVSPFMLMVYPVKQELRDKIPAVTHVDGSARVQTVSQNQNEKFYRLIKAFGEKTGIFLLLNTSFNENEPIVESPSQAIQCFVRNEMDILVLGNYVTEKNE